MFDYRHDKKPEVGGRRDGVMDEGTAWDGSDRYKGGVEEAYNIIVMDWLMTRLVDDSRSYGVFRTWWVGSKGVEDYWSHSTCTCWGCHHRCHLREFDTRSEMRG